MNDNEAQQFLAASKVNKWHPLFTMMLTTGLRPSEVLALSWQDIDFNK